MHQCSGRYPGWVDLCKHLTVKLFLQHQINHLWAFSQQLSPSLTSIPNLGLPNNKGRPGPKQAEQNCHGLSAAGLLPLCFPSQFLGLWCLPRERGEILPSLIQGLSGSVWLQPAVSSPHLMLEMG